MSWMRSGTKFSQFLRDFLPTLATQFKHVLNLCIKETKFRFKPLLLNYVPLNDIYIFTITHCSTASASPPSIFDVGI